MKKMILTATAIVALASASLATARAGDREWATVGKVLTGVVAFNVITHAAAEPCYPADYAYRTPAYYPPPAPPCAYTYAYCPPPRVVVIHNWSPTEYGRSYCPPVEVYPSHHFNRHERRDDRW